ncbi:MAG: hypothetical protein H6Q84_307 [Deltaproteobacteria bacterium]|nr:hypothetical protein [Deltaproteobacteria bacterium]
MNPVPFSLVPFPGEIDLPSLRLSGTIVRRGDLLSIVYELRGDLSVLAIPRRAEFPERKHRLWEETCLEFFLGARDTAGYLEFNLSPGGHWNAYRFSAYREGMREEEAIASLPFRVDPGAENLRLSLDLEIGKILPGNADAEAGICAVLRTASGGRCHWALAHPGPRPDFHRRDGFVLTLPSE